MKWPSTILLVLCFSFSALSQSQLRIYEEWKGFSDPDIMSSGFTHKLSLLPLEGMIDIGPKAWSSTYWPSAKGGINSRWNSEEQEGFRYKSPSQEVVKKMSREELMSLSPTEKYDLFTGQYSYPLRREAEGTASRHARDWAGICHGWAPAALHHNEPTPKDMVNPDGINIPFGSADIKALLSYYYAFHFDADSTQQVGLRCFFGAWIGAGRGCNEDLNAGAFHIIISNKLGIQREGFLADIDRYKEVWNQPVVGFKTIVLNDNLPTSARAAKLATREMRLSTEFFYVDESDPTWNVVLRIK